jgi:hypothetical protein
MPSILARLQIVHSLESRYIKLAPTRAPEIDVSTIRRTHSRL